jgi:hypothetical protein
MGATSGQGEEVRTAEWLSWDAATHEMCTIRHENAGWTIDGVVTGRGAEGDVQYVIRVDDRWQVRQFLLFRDLEEPDLWLARDAQGRWGEVNGAYREDLSGCTSVGLDVSPITAALLVRQGGGPALVAVVDVDTLLITPRWQRIEGAEVDDDGWLLDDPGRFRRVA